MGFKLNFDEAFEQKDTKIEDGTYEVVIEKAREEATPTGAEFLDFWLRIRSDVKQAAQNQIIFHKVWKGKQTGVYHTGMINTLAKSAALENGKEYNSLQDLLNDFLNKPLKATVKNEKSTYNGKEYDNLNVKFTEVTEYPNVQRVTPTNTQVSGPVDITDEDLPF